MEQDTDRLVEKKFKELPVPLQRAITLTPWRKMVQDIAAAHNLDPEKFDDLETEAMLVMYGFQSQDDIVSNITTEVGVDKTQAEILAREIVTEVFRIVLEKAEKLSQETTVTLQNVEENKPETQEIAPNVVVEAPKPERPSINLIQTPKEAEEKLLTPPKAEESPVTLAPAPSNLPAAPTPKPSNLIPEALTKTAPPEGKNPAYPGGKDPYREEF
jgi:hypothetical protein